MLRTGFAQSVDTGLNLCRIIRELVQRVVSGFDTRRREHTLISHVRTVFWETGTQYGGSSLWSDAFQVRKGRDGCS